MITGPWDYDLSLQEYSVKTQTATALIQEYTPTKTQTATAAIVTSTATGPWDYDLELLSILTFTQSATARIQSVTTKTQMATATISDWVVIDSIAANSELYDDFTVENGITYQYRVVPVASGVDGEYITSNEITYTGQSGSESTKTQTALARIAANSVNNAGMMMGMNF